MERIRPGRAKRRQSDERQTRPRLRESPPARATQSPRVHRRSHTRRDGGVAKFRWRLGAGSLIARMPRTAPAHERRPRTAFRRSQRSRDPGPTTAFPSIRGRFDSIGGRQPSKHEATTSLWSRPSRLGRIEFALQHARVPNAKSTQVSVWAGRASESELSPAQSCESSRARPQSGRTKRSALPSHRCSPRVRGTG